MLKAIPCTVMRGGTSKGLYFDAADLPADPAVRDRVLLAAMGSPDARQIDGMGGAHSLTSKVAVLSRSAHPDADVDYLFLQVVVDRAEVSDSQNCGNILAGVGPWAIEAGWVPVAGEVTPVRIHMVNSGSFATALVPTPDGHVTYEGSARIDGVPGTAAPIPLEFLGVAGSSCGALLPTGRVRDTVDGIDVTCIDNGMPIVLLRAADFGLSGTEAPEVLEADNALKTRIEALRLNLGPLMNLGDVAKKTVPKMTLVGPAQHGGVLTTRSFIPHRVHEAIGVLGAVSVATACVIPGSIAAEFSAGLSAEDGLVLEIEHPTGFFSINMVAQVSGDPLKPDVVVSRSALLRTARKLMRGSVFVPASLWETAP